MKNIVLCLSLLFVMPAFGQEKYWVFFKDKAAVQAHMQQPEKFLSERALARRAKFNIPISPADVPVNPQYIQALKDAGFEVVHQSKWLNAVSVRCGAAQVSKAATLPMVLEVQKVKALQSHHLNMAYEPPVTFNKTQLTYDYGNATDQIALHNGQVLHENGFTGSTKLIAVCDGGFAGADPASPFLVMHQRGQIVHTQDFVGGGTNVYRAGSHGTRVLSTMGFFNDGVFVGTAPDAQYLLFRTENESSETRQEEDNWVAAAEMADSIGADLINTSLGYNTFDDPNDNYTYADMDGRTTIISRGAVAAARTGMLLVTSAGNEGARPWRHITAPADADSILTVGAVTSLGDPVPFSSEGPTADGRIKPNVVAQGAAAAVVTGNGFATNSGTSFSSPIMCGLVACLWEAFPNENNMQIIKRVERASHRFLNPDNKEGHGIPDFAKALADTSSLQFEAPLVFPNPFGNTINIRLATGAQAAVKAAIFNVFGAVVFEAPIAPDGKNFTITLNKQLAVGTYFLHLVAEDGQRILVTPMVSQPQ